MKSSEDVKNFVSIIMVTYNSVSKLGSFFDDTIHSIMNLDYDNYALIVVDNNSQDNTINHIKELMKGFKGKYFIVKLKRNKGLPYAYNVGAIAAVKLFPDTKYFLFVNDDVILSRNIISTLIEGLKSSCRAIQPVIIHLDGHKEVGFKIGVTGYVKPIEYEEVRSLAPLVRVPVIAGAALMVAKEVFFSVGMFDGDMFWGCDDVDFCWRLYKYGYITCITTKTHVTHYGSATWGKENPIKYFYGTLNLIYVFYKNHNFARSFLLTPVLMIEILRILFWKLCQRDSKSIKAILSGAFNGVLKIPLALKISRTLKHSRTPITYFDLKVDLELIFGRFYKMIFQGEE
jgi:GT2 family glycosyltransferase